MKTRLNDILSNNMAEILDVVNRNDEVIGQAERDEVHRVGLVCRMVYVCFYTIDKDIILQRRSVTKKSNPGRLTTAVSGHVESGSTYYESALKETIEETGVEIEPAKLTDLGVIYVEYTENETYISNAMRGVYAYRFDGDVRELKVEEGEGAGFELIPIHQLRNDMLASPDKFVPILTGEHGASVLDRIERL